MNNNIIKILIVGAGNIGSRHLEGAVKNKNQLSIIVVDKYYQAFKYSKNLVKRKNFGNPLTKVVYKKKIPEGKNFDICIVSTRADVRAKITIDLLNKCKTRFIIFEKVLFQTISDFKIISSILKKKEVKAWVNCPRRTYSFYKDIKKKIDLKMPVKIEVSGSSWNMACNAIHFVDLFSYLINDSNLKITKKNFSKKIFKTKRGKGFYEINGSIKFVNREHSLLITCNENKNISLNINIINGNVKNSVEEVNEIWINEIDGFKNIKKIRIPYQSDQTSNLINSIINNKCGLETYENSTKHHTPLLNAIKEHLSKILNKKIIKCPIT